jgi:hypothetical protein
MFTISDLVPYFTPVRSQFRGSPGATLVCSPNPARAYLAMSSVDSVPLYLDTISYAVSPMYQVILISGGTNIWYWSRDSLLCTVAWYWYPIAVGVHLTVTELIWQPQRG